MMHNHCLAYIGRLESASPDRVRRLVARRYSGSRVGPEECAELDSYEPNAGTGSAEYFPYRL